MTDTDHDKIDEMYFGMPVTRIYTEVVKRTAPKQFIVGDELHVAVRRFGPNGSDTEERTYHVHSDGVQCAEYVPVIADIEGCGRLDELRRGEKIESRYADELASKYRA